MNVNIRYSSEKMTVNETFSGGTADQVVGAMKARVTKELPFAMRLLAGSMSNLGFAQEVVRRYNSEKKKTLPQPASCDEFLQLAVAEGFGTIEA